MIADQNASRRFCRFASAPDGLRLIDRDEVFADYWNHDDPVLRDRHKGIKCAEVLVPDGVNPTMIIGAYVSCEPARRSLQKVAADLPVALNSHLFFKRT